MSPISPNALLVFDVADEACPSNANARVYWAEFVTKHDGNYCLFYEWQQVLKNAYRLDTHYLVIAEKDKWLGILPLAIIKSLLGSKAVSLPYCNYGGLLVSNGADKNYLRLAALSYLKDKGINQIEMRELCQFETASDSSEVTLMLDFPQSADLLWKKIGDKARNQVRKAERAGLEVRWGRDQASELYEIYAENMGRLGTPVHARAFVDEILAAFGERADVLTVRLQGRSVAAMLVLKCGDTWIDPIASSLTEFNNLNPNMLLYWEALRQASLSGARRFDFGRSKKDSGTYRFKQQWGAVEVPLDYHSYVDGVRISSASTNTYRGNKAAMFAKVWSKLPRSFQRYFGPKIRRHIP